MVLVSRTAFKLREVLNWRAVAVDGACASASVLEAASEMAACTLLKDGFSVVRRGEGDVAGPVMWSDRALRGVLLAASLLNVRNEAAREAAIVSKVLLWVRTRSRLDCTCERNWAGMKGNGTAINEGDQERLLSSAACI